MATPYRVFVRTGRDEGHPRRECSVTVLAESPGQAGQMAALEVIAFGESAEVLDVVTVDPRTPTVLDHTWLFAE